MEKGKVVSLEDRIPKLKQQRRKRANKRLIILLFFFFTLLCLIIYFQSPLSHLKNIAVKGNEFYPTEVITKASGLTKSTSIWKIEEEQIIKKVSELPEIKNVTVKVKLPNTVLINVTEHERIAYVNMKGGFSPVIDNGEVLPKMETGALPVNAPILYGFSKGKVLEKMVGALAGLSDGIVNSISEVHYTPTASDKNKITLYMNNGFEVLASLSSFSEKMSHYPSIISQLDEAEKGIIDLQVGSFFKAYDQEGAEIDENESEG